MRKHFLILMLLALLPLAGWAAVVPYDDYADLSEGWSIKLSKTADTYTGASLTPTVTLTRKDPGNAENTQEISSDNFKVTWRNSSNQVVTEIVNFDEGGYTVTVEKNNVKTWGELATPTKKFMVMKATVVEKTAGAVRTTGLNWTGNPITLLTAHYKAKISGTTVEVPVKYSIGKTGELTSDFPTATKVGTYKLFWNVEESDNYAGTQVEIGDVTITGNNINPSDYTAPAAVDGTLTFTWENNAAKALNLLKANTGTIVASKGTFMYAVRTEEVASQAALEALPANAWTTTATAKNAGNYFVYWMIKGGEGQNDVAPAMANKFEKSVAKADIVITSAVGYGNLSYKVSGDHQQNLIQTAGSATNGATSLLKYRVRYKASATAPSYGEWSEYKAANAIKGTAAGIYQIETAKVDPASGAINYNAADAQYTEIAISKANALTSAPTAADLTWNGAAQQLITAGAGSTTEGNIITYGFSDDAEHQPSTWTGDITTIKRTDAASNYYVWFQVAENANYATIAPTLIENVMIKRKDVSFKVNDITKTYNGLVDLADATIDGTETAVATAGAARFTITGLIDASDFSGIAYSDLPEYCKNANEYANVMTVAETALNGVNPNYRYTIIPGKLTIKKVKLTVTAVSKNATFGQPYDVSDSYTITGLVPVPGQTYNEPASAAFQTLPTLTTNAAAVNPAPGVYEYTFTKGVLKTTCNYEMDTTYGENNDGYKIGTAKFTVNQDPEAKIVITVAAHTQSYTGVAESWDNMVEGKDYYVTGLVSGDKLTVAPTFTRSDATNFNVGTYDLEASGAAVADIKQYPGGIIYQKSTFKITPAKLTATINQQTVPVNPLADAFDLDAWDVEGLQGPDATTGKSVLNGQLAYNEGAAAPAANLATAGVYTQGIKLTINNANYELAGANVTAGKAYGTLIVTDAEVLALQSTDDNLLGKLQAAETHNTNYGVCFVGDDREMLAKEWYAVVLPFETTPLELSTKLETYVVVNLLKSSKIEFNSTTNRDEAVVNFGIEMDKIPAGTPFLIKPAQDVEWNVIGFGNKITGKKIKSTVVPTVTEKATFSATYETGKSLKWGYELDGTTENADMKYRWLANTTDQRSDNSAYDNAWYNCKTNAHALELMEAFLILDPAAQGARIFVEDIDDNGTTAIKSLNADQVNGLKVAEGWYTINGVKLQGMPTEKGIYINNGKKVVVK